VSNFFSEIQPKKRFFNTEIRERKSKLRVFNFGGIFLSFLVIFSLLFTSVSLAPAQTTSSDSVEQENNQEDINEEQKNPFDEYRKTLESELQEILNKIDEYKNELEKISKNKQTLQREVNYYDTLVKKINLEIKAIEIEIKELDKQIAETNKSIEEIKFKIKRNKESLKEALRVLYKNQKKSLVDILIESEHLSDFFNKIVTLDKLQISLQKKIDALKLIYKELQEKEEQLEEEQAQKVALLNAQEIKKRELSNILNKKQELLRLTKGKEANYQKLIKESEIKAAQIRTKIYQLAGGVGDITFETALKYAELASQVTGVRPAFLLAVLDYESKIGKNVGTCNYKKAMNPKEWPLFEKIVNELGLDPNQMPVSCKPWYGWGGAMGPAQFLPSTWLKYKERIAKITGHNPPSPWNIIDSFVAAALYLADVGATKKTYYAEWKAAMIYFAGSNWNKKAYRFYGDSVMQIAENYQKDIDILKSSQEKAENKKSNERL